MKKGFTVHIQSANIDRFSPIHGSNTKYIQDRDTFRKRSFMNLFSGHCYFYFTTESCENRELRSGVVRHSSLLCTSTLKLSSETLLASEKSQFASGLRKLDFLILYYKFSWFDSTTTYSFFNGMSSKCLK